MSLPKYANYRDSGVDWLGEVPAHWDVIALKRIASLKSGDSITSESIEETGDYPVLGGNGLRGFTTAFTHEGHFVVIGRQGALCGNINYGTGRFWASEHAVVASPLKPVETVWLGEMLRAMNLNQHSVSAAQPGLSMEFVGNLRTVSPPLTDQAFIAAFLVRETKKIDELVAEQRRLIELLKEKRRAVISHAVTRGLNPHAPMKHSGIEWLGDVPEHWDCAALTRIADRVVVGIAEAATHAYADDGIPILRSTNIRAGRIIGDIFFINPAFAGDRESKRISAGDLVSVRTGNAGVTAVVPPELDGCQCFTMLITSLKKSESAEFYCYWMNSISAQCYFSLEGWGTAQVNISVPILKALPVPIPPRSEQLAIVQYLDRQIAKLDALTAESERAIDLLQEHRTALLSAAVTGKIDVRGSVESEAA